MPATTVSELIARAKAAADMEDSGFVTTAQWLRWANLEHRMFYAWLARQGYANNPDTAAHTADGTGTFTAIQDPMVILGVWESTGQTYRPLRAIDQLRFQEHGTVTGPAHYYAVFDAGDGGMTLSLAPKPSSGSYLALYLAHPAELVLGSPGAGQANSVRYPLGLEERVVLGMARRALAKEESSTSEVVRQIREVEAHAEAVAWDRVSGGVQSVRNVDHRERGWSDLATTSPRDWYWVS